MASSAIIIFDHSVSWPSFIYINGAHLFGSNHTRRRGAQYPFIHLIFVDVLPGRVDMGEFFRNGVAQVIDSSVQKSPWSMGKALFFIVRQFPTCPRPVPHATSPKNRYYTLISVLCVQRCISHCLTDVARAQHQQLRFVRQTRPRMPLLTTPLRSSFQSLPHRYSESFVLPSLDLCL